MVDPIFNNTTPGEAKLRRFIFVLLIFAALAIWTLPATAGAKPVAKVNGSVLTEADLQAALNEIMPAGVFHGGFSSEKRAKQRPRALELMIEKELFYQEAVKTGVEIDEDAIETERERTIRRLGGKKKFRAALKKTGLSDKQYREKLRKKDLIKRLIAIETKDKSVAGDNEVRTYYESNKNRYMRPEARRITHILIAVKPEASSRERALKKKKAQEVIDKIKAGEDMSVVAWDYSNDPYRVKGGDFGLVHRGRLDPALEKEVFKLEPGQLSGIIESIYGYHVVRVEEIKPSTQLSLEEVSEKIKKQLMEKKEKQLRQALVSRLKEKAQIEVY